MTAGIDSSGNPDLRLSTVNCQLPTEIIMLDFITWTADPAIFTIGSREIRWYGLAFAIGFAIGYMIVERMWKKEGLAARMDRFPFDLYDARYGDWCPFGALFVLCAGILFSQPD